MDFLDSVPLISKESLELNNSVEINEVTKTLVSVVNRIHVVVSEPLERIVVSYKCVSDALSRLLLLLGFLFQFPQFTL